MLVMLALTPFDQWGPEITNDPEMRDRVHFKSFALGGTNNHNDIATTTTPSTMLDSESLMSLNGAHVIFSSPRFYR